MELQEHCTRKLCCRGNIAFSCIITIILGQTVLKVLCGLGAASLGIGAVISLGSMYTLLQGKHPFLSNLVPVCWLSCSREKNNWSQVPQGEREMVPHIPKKLGYTFHYSIQENYNPSEYFEGCT